MKKLKKILFYAVIVTGWVYLVHCGGKSTDGDKNTNITIDEKIPSDWDLNGDWAGSKWKIADE